MSYETKNSITLERIIALFDDLKDRILTFEKIDQYNILRDSVKLSNELFETIGEDNIHSGNFDRSHFIVNINTINEYFKKIKEYCKAHGIIEAWYYDMIKFSVLLDLYVKKISFISKILEKFFEEFLFIESVRVGEWPIDLIHSAAIVTESAAEAAKEAFNFEYRGRGGKPKNQCLDDMGDELIKVGAMAARCAFAIYDGFKNVKN